MARPAEAVDVKLAKKARADLRTIKDHEIARRLLVIAACEAHSTTLVCEIHDVGRTTLWRWANSYREDGIEGLRSKPKGHRPRKITDKQFEQIGRWIEQGKDSKDDPVHWTLERLSLEIKREFGVSITLNPLWQQLRKKGFRIKVPRPHHAQADPAAQDDFKKNG